MFYYDPTYILILIGAGLSIWASSNVKHVMQRYRGTHTQSGLTAYMAAREILRARSIFDVAITRLPEGASDYYSPVNKELCLLSSNYGATDITAIGVAAHECGHAIQDAEGYGPLKLQRALYPVCSFGSGLGVPVILAGFIFQAEPLIQLGIFLFSLSVVLSLILLPVEFDASNRALKILREMRMMNEEELEGAAQVLRAAGMTYVAAAAASVLSLLRLVLISGGRRGRDS